jgi:hypothetical protein
MAQSEWVADVVGTIGIVMGLAACNDFSSKGVTDTYVHRCCSQ